MKNFIYKVGLWVQDNWVLIVMFASGVMILFLILILISWLAGYWLKALYGMNFDLNSCWQGVGAVIAGICSIYTMAKAAWTKYRTDSELNTLPTEMPRYQPGPNNPIKRDNIKVGDGLK